MTKRMFFRSAARAAVVCLCLASSGASRGSVCALELRKDTLGSGAETATFLQKHEARAKQAPHSDINLESFIFELLTTRNIKTLHSGQSKHQRASSVRRRMRKTNSRRGSTLRSSVTDFPVSKKVSYEMLQFGYAVSIFTVGLLTFALDYTEYTHVQGPPDSDTPRYAHTFYELWNFPHEHDSQNHPKEFYLGSHSLPQPPSNSENRHFPNNIADKGAQNLCRPTHAHNSKH